jgi:hypothetical protein
MAVDDLLHPRVVYDAPATRTERHCRYPAVSGGKVCCVTIRRIDQIMTRAELDQEFRAITAEHRALAAEHDAVHGRPHDLEGHRAHARRLRAHLDRLRWFLKASGVESTKVAPNSG